MPPPPEGEGFTFGLTEGRLLLVERSPPCRRAGLEAAGRRRRAKVHMV